MTTRTRPPTRASTRGGGEANVAISDWPFTVSRDEVHSAIIEMSRAGVFVCDRDYRIWDVDGTFLEAEGRPRADVVGRHVAEILGDTVFEARRANIDRAFAGIASRLRSPGLRDRTRGITLEVFFQPIFDADGIVACVASTARDVTLFEQINERLSMHEEIVRQTSDRISVIGTDYVYRFTNHANAAFYGMAPEDLIGRDVRQMIGIECFEARSRHYFERCFAGESVEYEYGIAADAEDAKRYVRIKMDPYRDRSGQVTAAVLVMTDVTAATRMAQELRRQAQEDALTGLANRHALQGALEAALAQAQTSLLHGALLTIDIDGFKLVNDIAGHSAGDALLCQIADMLRTFETDGGVCCARIGGDEFAVLCQRTTVDAASALGDRIVANVFEMPFTWRGTRHRIGASVGIAMIGPQSEEEALPRTTHQILNQADQACLYAKEMGGGRAVVYRPQAAEMVARRADIGNLQLIRRSLETGHFQLYTMAIAPIDGTSLPMCEALLRFVNEDGRVLPPSSLIATAERHGLMQEIDRWVVTTALRHVGELDASIRLTINLSGLSVGDPEFKDFLLEALERMPELCERISFEITETAAVRSMATARALIFALRECGCGVILDDFGSGLSSFAYLRQFPIDSLKIDGGIIGDVAHDELQRTIVAGIVAVARQIGVSVIAEYVEDAETLAVLRDLGVTHAQGYHVGRPQRWIDGAAV